jgi:regulator of protease activity HflC (stomatin/prohibitin superfamily)
MEYLIVLVVLSACVIYVRHLFKRTVIAEYQRGVRYSLGRFDGVLEPGRYWHLAKSVSIRIVDIRPRYVTVPGQELISADGVTMKLSLAAEFEVRDPQKALNDVYDYEEALYVQLQLALRDIVSETDLDAVLAGREEISDKLMALCTEKADALGLGLLAASVKDIMLPGRMREILSQVVNARKEGMAALERARGETAALRKLANAANVFEGNPNLMQLRLLQVLGEKSGNTVVLGMPAHGTAVPIGKTDQAAIPEAETPGETEG